MARGRHTNIFHAETKKVYKDPKSVKYDIRRQYHHNSVGTYSTYDPESLMQFVDFSDHSSFLCANKSATSYPLSGDMMVPHQPESVPPVRENKVLSDVDKAFLVLTYPRTTPHPDAPEWTVGHALETAGVPDEDQREIIVDGSPDEIRRRFCEWNRKQWDNKRAMDNPKGERQCCTVM